MVLEDGFSDEEKLAILNYIGERARSKYNQNLFFGTGSSYNLRFMMNSLQFEPDLDEFENNYWIDLGDENGNRLATYFEFGTGLFNAKNPKEITAKSKKIMKFGGTFKYRGKTIFTRKVKGVRAVFPFKRTIEWLKHNRLAGENLQERAINKLGIA